MLLSLLLITPFLSGIFSFFSFRINKDIPRWIALTGITITLLIVIKMCFFSNYSSHQIEKYPCWDEQLILPWIPILGIDFHIAIDSFSKIMLFLTSFLGIIAILVSWYEIKKNEGFFYFNVMLVITGIIGIFIACDLFLFFFFWEVVLIPIYFLISLWNRDKNKSHKSINTANKFFIYSQMSGLLMLVSILLLVFSHYKNTDLLTFNYDILLTGSIDSEIEYISMLGFFLAFAIKMPIFPFHDWLLDFHAKSIYCGTVDIISVLLKIAPYGLLRYSRVFFPHVSEKFSFIIILLGLFTVFYGAWAAFSQLDIKRLIAYSSISHMGLILIAIYSNNEIAFKGAVIEILSNSISTAALCIISGQIYKYLKTQDISQMGGLWESIYWIPGFSLFFSLANLGLPGTGNFSGEFLMLFGTFKTYPIISSIAVISIVFSSLYSLNMIQKIYFGKQKQIISIFFPHIKEFLILIILAFSVILLGLIPQNILCSSFEVIHSIYNFKK